MKGQKAGETVKLGGGGGGGRVGGKSEGRPLATQITPDCKSRFDKRRGATRIRPCTYAYCTLDERIPKGKEKGEGDEYPLCWWKTALSLFTACPVFFGGR